MLSGVFLARWPGSSGFRASRERLEDALSEAVARGRAAWPQLALDVDGFVAHVAMRVPADGDLEAALAGLHGGKRHRTLLRLNLVDGLNIDKIGALYGVHRATVASWIAGARDEILTATRKALQERLKLSRAEFESLMGLVVSNLEVSLSRLLLT